MTFVIRKWEIIEFLRDESQAGRPVSFEDLIDEFDLIPEAACGHLSRLWRERLIESNSQRPRQFRFRLQPDESIRPLSFRISKRGKQWLRWYEDEDDWF